MCVCEYRRLAEDVGYGGGAGDEGETANNDGRRTRQERAYRTISSLPERVDRLSGTMQIHQSLTLEDKYKTRQEGRSIANTRYHSLDVLNGPQGRARGDAATGAQENSALTPNMFSNSPTGQANMRISRRLLVENSSPEISLCSYGSSPAS
ncbi:hypothetical protein AAP_06049 [Ascosphaera apis ARSEF 7405]|uniref:Uncharacterized protein n=1 Tax=Ascosphaera apis ARSEF 7405 TaxID=392613 RepID=A0A167V247_9EURO|nr:hypothetical protein AAP_06049 [Ascosphaera apis ARSEF 7405]